MPESDDIRQAMVRFYELFSAGDAAAFGESLTTEEHASIIGSDWGQWEDGRDAWIEAFESQMADTPGARLEAGGRLRGYAAGDVGWAADQPNLVLGDDFALPLRITAVFHREAGEWRMVSAHVSLGVPDAKLEQLLPDLLG